MTTPPAPQVQPETGPMLFADCPFCLGPMPLDAATGTADCPACAVRLELAWGPAPERAPAADATVALAPAA
jgi:hypothetical protein